jgi:hypothetical protein
MLQRGARQHEPRDDAAVPRPACTQPRAQQGTTALSRPSPLPAATQQIHPSPARPLVLGRGASQGHSLCVHSSVGASSSALRGQESSKVRSLSDESRRRARLGHPAVAASRHVAPAALAQCSLEPLGQLWPNRRFDASMMLVWRVQKRVLLLLGTSLHRWQRWQGKATQWALISVRASPSSATVRAASRALTGHSVCQRCAQLDCCGVARSRRGMIVTSRIASSESGMHGRERE